MIRLDHGFLRGSYPPLVTPFTEGKVDLDLFAKLVDRQVAEGSHGILVTGTTAEPSSLTVAERCALVKVAVETVAGRIPVVAATGSQSYAETMELTCHAEKAGADALLVVTPYYIRPPQQGLVDYFVAVGSLTRLPLMIYHIPGRAAVSAAVMNSSVVSGARRSRIRSSSRTCGESALATSIPALFAPAMKSFWLSRLAASASRSSLERA